MHQISFWGVRRGGLYSGYHREGGAPQGAWRRAAKAMLIFLFFLIFHQQNSIHTRALS
jgi:hypothetical protein